MTSRRWSHGNKNYQTIDWNFTRNDFRISEYHRISGAKRYTKTHPSAEFLKQEHFGSADISNAHHQRAILRHRTPPGPWVGPCKGPRRKDHVEFGEAFLLQKFPTGDGLAQLKIISPKNCRNKLIWNRMEQVLKLRNPKRFPNSVKVPEMSEGFLNLDFTFTKPATQRLPTSRLHAAPLLDLQEKGPHPATPPSPWKPSRHDVARPRRDGSWPQLARDMLCIEMGTMYQHSCTHHASCMLIHRISQDFTGKCIQ